MSREIEFRAWDPDMNIMQEQPYICCLGGGGQEIEFADEDGNYQPAPNAILMQSTGLRDSKRTKEFPEGQKIFEGDVFEDKQGNRSVVVWDADDCKFDNTDIEDYKSWIAGEISLEPACYSESVFVYNEVIGSIHTHPELLKGN